MKFAHVKAVFLKESLDMLRDRRTLISMIAVPLLVIPLLLAVTTRLMARVQKKSEEDAKAIGIAVRTSMPGIREALAASGLNITDRDDFRAAIESKLIAAAVVESVDKSGVPELEILTDRSNPVSNAAADRIRTTLDGLKTRAVAESLKKAGVDPSLLNPFTIKRTNVAGDRKMAGAAWGSMLGYVLLLLMFTGGMYPIIDMTAGEKERRTLEAFLAAPVGRRDIVLGKTLTGMVAIFLTALLTLGSMVVSLRSQRLSGREEVNRIMGTIPLDANTVFLIVVTLFPLAVFAAAVMMAIALLAKSFKEGQSYLTPLALVVIFPALLGGLPGLEMTPLLAMIPIFNASQIIRGILLGEFSALNFGFTMAANLIYAAAAFLFASRTFENENVLFRS